MHRFILLKQLLIFLQDSNLTTIATGEETFKMHFTGNVIVQSIIPVVIVFLQLPVTSAGGYRPIRTTKNGAVFGKIENVHGTKVEVYWGIPYAQPPVGELRFKHPKPVANWTDVYNATMRPNACIQGIDTMDHEGAKVWNANTKRSEDCLYLNVWVPKTVARSPTSKAVMIWIFGGGFYSGSAALDIYDAKYIAAENDVVVVSMQYRLGALGFLALHHPENPSNCGMFDQLMALNWVQENIQYFEGNPDSVTLFGESAGAVSVGMHLLSPLSTSKFDRVIMQSGAPQAAWATLSDKEAKNRSLLLAEKMGCPISMETLDIIECLRGKNASQFPTMEWRLIDFGVVRFPFVPTIDGAFLTEDPEKSLRKGDFKNCEMLIGHNLNEANYWLLYYDAGVFPVNATPQISQFSFDLQLDSIFNYHPYYPKHLNSFGKEAIKFQYRNWINPENQKMNAWQLDMAVGDFNFICPCVDLALHYASKNLKNVYYYTFEHRSTIHYWPEWMGVLHADEINFVFGEPFNPKFHYSDQEKKFSKKMMKYWTNFAKTG